MSVCRGNDRRKVAKQLAKVAVAFVRIAEALGLQLSVDEPAAHKVGKSTLVTNNKVVREVVLKHMAFAGVHIQIKAAARDLGVMFVGGGFRRVVLQKKRLPTGCERLRRIK